MKFGTDESCLLIQLKSVIDNIMFSNTINLEIINIDGLNCDCFFLNRNNSVMRFWFQLCLQINHVHHNFIGKWSIVSSPEQYGFFHEHKPKPFFCTYFVLLKACKHTYRQALSSVLWLRYYVNMKPLLLLLTCL